MLTCVGVVRHCCCEQSPVLFVSQRIKQRLCSLCAIFAELIHAGLNSRGYNIFHHYRNCKESIAKSVANVRARIAEHSKISPCVKLIYPACRYLVGNVLLDILPHCFCCLCVSVPHLLNIVGEQRFINFNVGCFFSFLLLHLTLDTVNATADTIQPRFGRKLVENVHRLHSLCCVS